MSRKKPRPLVREEMTYRDDRLFVIATEDTYAPKRYFEESSIFQNSRIKVRVLPTEDGLSAPEHVHGRLKSFRKEYELQEDDVLWLMLDVDHWADPNHISNFDKVCTEAGHLKFQLAHSNPCFEVWLLLHLMDLTSNDQFAKCADVAYRLKDALGTYSGTRLDLSRFNRENAATAVERAEKLDKSPNDRWPQKTGTHVY
jgi:hypothetical protein